MTASNLVTAEQPPLGWSCAGQGPSSPVGLGQKRRQRFCRQLPACQSSPGDETCPGLELGRGGGKVLVPPDPADSSTQRAYFILRLILSYRVIISLCPMEPSVPGGGESQPPAQELVHVGWERSTEREQDLGFPGGSGWASAETEGAALSPDTPRWVRPAWGAEKGLRPSVAGGYCTEELLRHHAVTSVREQSCIPGKTPRQAVRGEPTLPAQPPQDRGALAASVTQQAGGKGLRGHFCSVLRLVINLVFRETLGGTWRGISCYL